jgi:hypothetical protein
MKKESGANALTNDPAAFAAWGKLSNPTGMTESEVKSYLSSKGVFINPKGSIKTQRKGALEVGEVVKVEGKKCTHPQNIKNCGLLTHTPEKPMYCVILDINRPRDLREDCTIEVAPIDLSTGKPGNKFKFKAVLPVRIRGLQNKLEAAEKSGNLEKQEKVLEQMREKSLAPHDKVGLYRAFRNINSYLGSTATKPLFAVVYDRGGKSPAPQARRDLTQTMLESREKKTTLHGNFNDLMDSKLSEYSVIYYEGEVISAGYNKQGDFYFLLNERDGRGYTSINPSVGKLYFISSSKDVPAEKSWTEEFKSRLNDIVNTEVK